MTTEISVGSQHILYLYTDKCKLAHARKNKQTSIIHEQDARACPSLLGINIKDVRLPLLSSALL